MNLSILHVISSIDFSAGGPSKSVCDLALNQANFGHSVTIFTKKSNSPYLPESKHPNLVIFFVEGLSVFKELNFLLENNNFDIFHGHGIWQTLVHVMVRSAKKYRIPYVISPRGMLEPWALNHGRLKKKLALALFQEKDLKNASCIHATSEMEASNIQNLGFLNPIAVIPNGIDTGEFSNFKKINLKVKKNILFLSRIHQKKGIEILIYAWSKLAKEVRNGWEIDIVGNGEQKYVDSIDNLIKELCLFDEIKIIGPQYGDAKLNCYKQADLFVLPTYSENFGIVVAEALASGIPVITTKGTPWEELNLYNAGWWIDIGVDPLKEALEIAIRLSETDRQAMGISGRRLVENKYSIQSVAYQMIDLYKSILKVG